MSELLSEGQQLTSIDTHIDSAYTVRWCSEGFFTTLEEVD